MPRRLGDDPLSRKRSPSAKGNDAPSARLGFPAQQASHNDVFFRRKTEDPLPKPEGAPDMESSLGEATDVDDKPEISEVTDIMRTAKAVESTQGAEQLARPVSMDECLQIPAEEPVEKTERTPPTVSEPVASLEPPIPVTEEPAGLTSSQPKPEPEKSEGFFKRLFGRFGK